MQVKVVGYAGQITEIFIPTIQAFLYIHWLHLTVHSYTIPYVLLQRQGIRLA